MVTHYFTLRALSRELDGLLSGAAITALFSQQKNELLVAVDGGEPGRSLAVSVEPTLNYLCLRKNVSRAKKNSVDLFQSLVGAKITRIHIHPHERIVSLDTAENLTLLMQLYNASSSNILLVDARAVILDAFKYAKQLSGTPFAIDNRGFDERTAADEGLFGASLSGDDSRTVYAGLKETIPVLGSTYAREILHRVGIDERLTISRLDDDAVRRLHTELQSILRELERPLPSVYYRGGAAAVLSVVPLKHLAGTKIEEFPTVNDAVRVCLAAAFHTSAVDTEKKELLGKIKRELDRARRSSSALQRERSAASRAEEYSRIGKVIMANLQHLTKGTTSIELPDIFADEKIIRIALDPKLTPARNAERYFEKAKRAKASQAESMGRLERLEQRISLLEKLRLHLDNCHTVEQLREFKKTYGQESAATKVLKGEGPRLPFRVFSVHGETEVWVGKSGPDNDLLTMKYSKPNDLWFHVRGAGGSHTVLKVRTGTAPPHEALCAAARIAAYYSKMRKARNVPVSYCERRYVRKPKGSPEGTVTLEREKVLFVDPGLPDR